MNEGKKFHIIQLGCASNQADSNRISMYLQKRNYEIVDTLVDANIIIVMTCGFSQKQYDESISVISGIKEIEKKEIWIGGCIPAIKNTFYLEIPFQIDKIFTPRNFEERLDKYSKQQVITQPKQRICQMKSKLNAYPLRIVNGCSENCEYCVIKRAGGHTKSKSIEQIIHEIHEIDKHISALCLVGEEVGAYGKDINLSLFTLVENIIQVWPNIKISFSAIHPKYFLRDFEQYTKIFSLINIVPILPIPIQSGSDRILKLMKRDYLINDVIDHINLFIDKFPLVKVSTDIMVGFPEETWDDFLLTQGLIKNLPIFSLDSFKFDDMKGIGNTISEEEKIKRLKIIALTFVQKFCKENGLRNIMQFESYIKTNKIPLNLNF